MPLIPGLWRQRQAELCELGASLVYRVSFRTARTTQRNPVSIPHTSHTNWPFSMVSTYGCEKET